MKFRPIVVDNTQQELTQHGTEEFPMSMDRQYVANEDCRGIKHWHYEIQIALVTKGSVRYRTSIGEYLIKQGEGIFINRGVLHEALQTDEEDSVYICVNFKSNLIYGQSNNLIRRGYVDPLLFCAELQSFALRDKPWHKEICLLLKELGEINDAQEYGYELAMKIILCKIWHLIIINNREKTEKLAVLSFTDRQRIRAMQTFIHKKYMELRLSSQVQRLY